MSDGINRAILIGNLGDDPELRYTQAGQGVLNLRMATTETYVDREGEKKERTDWHNVVVWGKRGEGLAKCLRKGSRLCVEGRIQTRSYEKDGEKKYVTDVVATNVVLLDGRRSDARDDGERDSRGSRDERSRDRDERPRERRPDRRPRDERRAPPPDDGFAPPADDDRMPY